MKRFLCLSVVLTCVACGGGAPAAPSPSANPNTFTISTDGVTPKDITVPQGTRVLFVNNGNRSRTMTSDPHPEHSDCDEINNVGTLRPGEKRETGNLNTPRTCGFHDHDDPDNASVKGRIIIRP